MKHDCIQRINEQLAEHNTRISTALSIPDTTRELIHITTVKKDAGVRKKPMNLFASFCPFCGVSLGTHQQRQDGGEGK